jgi:serine O-acetyltransferase
MELSLPKSNLVEYIFRQLDQFFPDGKMVNRQKVADCFDLVLDRVEYCFSAIHNRYFQQNGSTIFNHLNSDQYAMLLYILSNTLFREGQDRDLCDKLFCLNKLLNGIDAFYEVNLPNIFLFCHPLGTILGRAQYSEYFLVYQDCTVGTSREAEKNNNSIYPFLGQYCALYKGAAVLGNCHIGNNCKIAAHSILIDQDLSDNSIYIGDSRSHLVKTNKQPDNIWLNK